MSTPPPPFSGGPLQPSDLLGIWVSVMDDSYTEPFVAAGDGLGLEAWNQSFAQLARVSQAIDVTMEALFILPWSGQSNPPASGPNQATVLLTLSRTGLLSQPLVLGAGFTWVDEVAPDWSPSGTQLVASGLRYSLVSTLIFEPGESGPLTVEAIAERPGYGYNNPLPGSLNTIEQPGTSYYNVDAAVTSSLATLPITPGVAALATMTVIDVPHVVVPEHVGQYVAFTAGTNNGAIARMVSFRAANPGVDGGAVGLELFFAVHASTYSSSPSFSPGELVMIIAGSIVTTIAAGSNGQTLPQSTIHVASTVGFPAHGTIYVQGSVVTYTGTTATTFIGCTGGTATLATGQAVSSVAGYATFVHEVVVGAVSPILKASFVMRTGTIAPTDAILSLATSAHLTADLVYTDASTLQSTSPSTVPSTESWRILDWVNDWGLSVTNAAQPAGGTSAMLDLLGRERDLPRISGENDAQYRQRVAVIADTVTPNAIKRRLNKVLTQGTLALGWCFREIGTPLFPGFFYDVDFYDYDAQLVTISGASPFQPNEPVTQTVSGVLATGKILTQLGVPPVPFVKGNAGATGNPTAANVIGVAGLHLGRTFVANVPIVGKHSGASANPVLVQGGLGVQYPGNNPLAIPVSNAWRTYVDYLRMRGYFVVNVARSDAGDFGFGWGSGVPGVGALADWWDAGPNWNDFYDGAPIGAANYYLAAYHAIDAIRAAGVYFEFFPMNGPCV